MVSNHLRNVSLLVKLDHFPKVWGENNRYLKPLPRQMCCTNICKHRQTTRWLTSFHKIHGLQLIHPLFLSNRRIFDALNVFHTYLGIVRHDMTCCCIWMLDIYDLQGSHYVLLLELGHEFKQFLSILAPYISKSKYSTHLDIRLKPTAFQPHVLLTQKVGVFWVIPDLFGAPAWGVVHM